MIKKSKSNKGKDQKGVSKDQNQQGNVNNSAKNGSNIKPGFKRKPWYKNIGIIIFFGIIIIALSARYATLEGDVEDVELGKILTRIESNDYEKVEVSQQSVKLIPKDEDEDALSAGIPSPDTFSDQLSKIDVNPKTEGIFYTNPSGFDIFSLLGALSWLILIGLIVYGLMSTRSLTSGGPMMGFGDSKAKLFVTGKKQNVKFDQIRGADEAVEDVKEVVTFLKSPQKFIKMGARIPKGVLLVGPPGTGKTLLARAIAGEASVPFFFTSGSEFEEMLVGTGASRVRDLFTKAKKSAPAIIFVDEIDSIAKKRGSVYHSGNTEQTLNQILVEMDGFDKNTNVIIIAATNRPDVLDPALLRPGRFDRRIMLELPDLKGREDILKVHGKNKPTSPEVSWQKVAKRTTGFSGADLENTLNESAIIATKAGRNQINPEDIEEAATKVTIGPAKKRVKSEKQKKITAYHEAGHAIAGYFTENTDMIHKISIISRGFTGGVTMYLPEEDDHELKSEAKFRAELIVLFGGRCAEELIFDTVTTGASSDIKRATQIARDMVKKYGMSDLGYIDLDTDEESNPYQIPYSDNTAENIDKEVNKILENAKKQCEKILSDNKNTLEKVANVLIEKEEIESDEFYELIEGKKKEEEKTEMLESK